MGSNVILIIELDGADNAKLVHQDACLIGGIKEMTIVVLLLDLIMGGCVCQHGTIDSIIGIIGIQVRSLWLEPSAGGPSGWCISGNFPWHRLPDRLYQRWTWKIYRQRFPEGSVLSGQQESQKICSSSINSCLKRVIFEASGTLVKPQNSEGTLRIQGKSEEGNLLG